MNNEPVAWIRKDNLARIKCCADIVRLQKRKIDDDFVPIYTHPAELTDEEIEEFEHLIAKAFDFSTQIKVVGLDRIIRAILRKAQEK